MRNSAYESTEGLDSTDRRILAELQADGRLSFARLGRRVGLSPPSIAERVRRLEDRGIIRGYTARVDPRSVGLQMLAFIRVSPSQGSGGTPVARVSKVVGEIGAVRECHHVSGEDCYVLKVAVRDVDGLRDLVEELSRVGRTTTSLVLSTVAEGRPVVPAEARQTAPARRAGRSDDQPSGWDG